MELNRHFTTFTSMPLYSPLRYPGGKASLTGFLSDVIALNDLTGGAYFEPYAGGAGAALGLLQEGAVSEIFLNDADERIYAFWHSALFDTDRFVERILNVPLTLEEWYAHREICRLPGNHDQFSVGFAAFYMNRCNRSGILTGSGPIGGYAQEGEWLIDARFNREELALRVRSLAQQSDHIHLSCLDAIDFLKARVPRGGGRNNVFVYLDPPYVGNGQRLYMNAYRPQDHALLANYLGDQNVLTWIMTYDDNDLVRRLYAANHLAAMPIRYTLQDRRAATELLVSPHRLGIPPVFRMHGQDNCLQPITCQWRPT